MPRRLLLIFLIIICISCNSGSVYSSFVSIKDSWKEADKIDFTFNAPDSVKTYDLFIYVRNDENYNFSNLFLIVDMNFPNGNRVVDTLQYEMAAPDGTWLGNGFTSLKESKLWYKEKIKFPASGEYNVQIQHAMRINGSVEGIKALEGIKDVGFGIEAATN